jgi:hypothetical protein
MSAFSSCNIVSVPSCSEILEETLELLGLFSNASSNLERLRILLRTHNKSGLDRKEAPASQGMLACLMVISAGPF